MRRAIDIKRQGEWSGPATARLSLAIADRHRRRVRMIDDAGEAFLLDLPHATLLADGDGLVLDGGGMILVRAADEAVADIQCRDAEHLARVCWHLGNRHLMIQVLGDGVVRILDDHVIVAMAEGLGAEVVCKQAPFQPEPGAYDGGGHHGHSHGHHHQNHDDDDKAHAHGH